VLLAALALLLALGVPWMPQPLLGRDVDSSWIMTLHHAAANGFHWGSDIIWHYGPLGFLYGKKYHPETFPLLIGFYLFFTAVFWVGVSALWRQSRVNGAVPIAAAFLATMTDNAFFLSFSLLLALYAVWGERGTRHWVFWLLLAATALTGWIKFTYLLAGLIVVLAIEASRLPQRKFPGVLLTYYIAVLLIAWLLLGQRMGDLLPYLQGAWELGSGFGAMASAYHSPLYAWLYGALTLAWIGAAAQVLYRERNQAALIAWGAALPLLLILIIKASFVHDNNHHIMEAVAWFFLLALLSKDFFWPRRSRLATAAIALIAVGSAGFLLVDYAIASRQELASVFKALAQDETVEEKSETAGIVMPEKSYAAIMAKTRDRYDFTALSGTADSYNFYQSILLAQPNLTYRPRPVFQSYHAYTPMLARLNRDHLRGPQAPEHILFSIDTMMQRYPSLDDGLSWPELLTRYDAVAINDGYLLLNRSKQPREFSLTHYADAQAKWNEIIAVPGTDQLVWAQVRFLENWKGKLARLLLAAVPVEMRFTLASGYTRTDRVTPASMEEGFLLSPLVDNALHFAMLGSDAREKLIARNRLAAVSFSYPACGVLCVEYFKDVIELRFFRLDLPAAQTASIEGWDDVMPYARLTSGMKVAAAEPVPSGFVTDRHIAFQQPGGKAAISIYGDANLSLPLAPEQSRVQMEIGSFMAFGQARTRPGPIDVTISGRHGGEIQIVWSATLPALEEGAFKPAMVDLNLTPGQFDALDISIRPQAPERNNWTYISGIAIR
jgi:hypothetical protein